VDYYSDVQFPLEEHEDVMREMHILRQQSTIDALRRFLQCFEELVLDELESIHPLKPWLIELQYLFFPCGRALNPETCAHFKASFTGVGK
jgi:hypothetical protein